MTLVNFIWFPVDVSVDMPDELDLTGYRGSGLQPNETELPEGDGIPEPGTNYFMCPINEKCPEVF